MARIVPEPDPRAVDSVMRAVAFVEERMGDEVGAQDMAAAACYSPFYFSRLFVQATGHSPYDYLMRRRVAAAAQRLREDRGSLTEIALDLGFDVQDSFARAFRRCFGMAPSEARRRGSYPAALARTPLCRPYVEAMLAGLVAAPERVGLPGPTLVGRAGEAGPPEAASYALRELDEGGEVVSSFVGAPSAESAAPPFPLAATAIPRGEGARFALPGPGSPSGQKAAEAVREYAYRCWLARREAVAAPRFELLELAGPGGPPAALILPLAP